MTDFTDMPFLLIYVKEKRNGKDTVMVQSYSMDGRRHTVPPKWLAPEKLPVLLYQLVDAGFTVEKDEKNPDLINCFGPAWKDYQRRKAIDRALSEFDATRPTSGGESEE